MKRCILAAITVLVLCLLWGGALAETQTINVATQEQFIAAVNTVNSSPDREFIISLTSDIEMNSDITFDSNATKTIVGNGHTINYNGNSHFIHFSSGTLNLGDGQSELILQGSTSNDEPGLIYIVKSIVESAPTCNMYDKVTIKENKTNNHLGGGVSIQGGTFHMYGGTIDKCGVDGGSVCYGGGVAVLSGGMFIMDGGVISNCYATSDHIDDLDPDRCKTSAGGACLLGMVLIL